MSAASVFVCILASAALAQPVGEVRIEVKDPLGAPMVASGSLTNLDTGVARRFQTDSAGSTTLSGVPYGRYRLEVSREGFAPQSSEFEITSSLPVQRAVTLQLAGPAYRMDVVGTTPLEGTELSLLKIPAPVQTGSAAQIESSGAFDLSGFLNRRFAGVSVNELQGNPYQADVNYRGYTASPLLGTPQGISVYMDGVRLNQSFGDTVNWDLIPKTAIAETTLMPGSNPMFGLNTLGGAVAVRTKSGVSHPGTSIQIGGGSFGRRTAEVEHGGSNRRGLNWYLAGNLFFEDGWRQDSPSNVRQFFGRLGWQGRNTSVNGAISYANNSLVGNGLQEERFLASNYSSVYTKPDITNNRSPMFTLSMQHALTSQLKLVANGYYRDTLSDTLNGDLNEDSLDQSVYQPNAVERAALAAAGYTGYPLSGENASNTPFPYWRCIAQVLLQDEPGEKCNGLLNRTHSKQKTGGASGQLSWNSLHSRGSNQLTAGAAYDQSAVSFLQSTQLGYLNPDRSVTPVDAYADGETGGTVDDEPLDSRVDLDSSVRALGLYGVDTFSMGQRTSFTVSARYNRVVVENRDRIRPGPQTGSLDGNHVFQRLNPSFGFTHSVPAFNLYASYSEGSRAPTAIELGCADPDQPCKLPNAMAGDPPLEQVVTRTWEAGVRNGADSQLRWNASWFRASNRNDILFVTSSQTGFGYFKNFGLTVRQGLELRASRRIWRIDAGAGYTFLDATYQTSETVNGSGNSSNSSAMNGDVGFDGTVQIQPGDRIPLLPRHLLKVYADVDLLPRLTLDAGCIAASSALARGNENGLHQPDGTYYLGPGESPAYAVVNMGARYHLNRWLQLFLQVNNLFDQRYYTAAQLGPTGFTNTGQYIARPFPASDGEYPIVHNTFLAPGAPRGFWGGLRVRF